MSDLISRQAAIDAMWEGMPGLTFNEALKRLRELPTAEPKKGKWIEAELDSTFLVCSVCKSDKVKLARAWRKEYAEIYRYCPNCGARMEGGDAT